MSVCPVKRIVESVPTMEGAGVKLRRAFACVLDGAGDFRGASAPFGVLTEKVGDDEGVVRETTGNRSLVLFDRGDEVRVRAETFIKVVR